MLCAPLRVHAHEIERITAGCFRLSGCDGDDGTQQFAAVTLRFFCKFLIHRVTILGALALQQLERSLPDLVAALVQSHDDALRQWSLSETLAPFPHLCDCGRHRYPL